MLLRRATGNHQINLEVRAFPGRSVDATVRTLDEDVLPLKPSIGLLMYGLNDQGAGTPLYAYLEQTRWIAARLARDCDADMVLLEPTPHIESVASAFRVIAFAQALGDLGAQLNLPVAATFNAIWGSGRTDLEQIIASMRPLFPPHFRKQWQSMVETGNKGDTIHPNVLGHLALAQAAFDAMVGRTPSPSPLRLSAEHAWTDDGLITRVHLALAGDHPRHGVLAFWSAADFATPLLEPVAYHLEPGGVQEVVIPWPTIRQPADLLAIPESAGRSVMQPMLAVVDQSGGLTTARALEPASPAPVTYVRSRLVTIDGVVEVPRTDGTTERVALGGEQAGEMLRQHNGAVSEMSFHRAGQVFPGEAVVDGALDEWPQSGWTVLGEPAQARWTKGRDDRRAEPGECYLRWAFRAGAQGMYAAVQVQGDIARDQFTLFFDPRRTGELGTLGPYYWCSGGFDKSGKLNLRPGETSPKKVEGLAAVWRGGSDGQTGVIEMFIPYALFKRDAWPADGALGFSIWWQHSGKGPGGGRTNLLWSERGHPWNTLRYGLLLRDDRPNAVLPRIVFVR